MESPKPGSLCVADLLDRFRADGETTAWTRVMLHRRDTRSMKSGKEYEVLLLGDATGQFDVRDFRCSVARAGHPEFMMAQIKVEEYQGQPSAILEAVDPLAPDTVRPDEFMAYDRDAVAAYKTEFDEALCSLSGHYRAVVEQAFDADVMDRFFLWPAASRHHHNYPGGLAQHTLEVLRYARALAQADALPYDRDLLVAGCLLHDIGKLDEYVAPPALGRSTAGQLAYHLAFGHLRLGGAAERLRAAGRPVPGDVIWKLMHLIEQSHGAHRLDMAREPVGKEARCLSAGDDHSAKNTPGDRERQVLDALGELAPDPMPF